MMLKKEVLDGYFKILLALCACLLALSCVFFAPAFRDCLISAAEKAVGRPLTRAVWHERMVRAETIVFVFLSVFCLYFLTFRATRFSGGAFLLFPPPGGGVFARRGRTIALFFVFAVCSLFRFYWMNQKTGFHEDELYSIGICNRNSGVYGFWDRELETGRVYRGAEITESAYFDSASPLDVANDVFHLWVNTKDSPHPNLYYVLLRVWFSFVDTSDFRTIFIRAGLLNYVFFAFSFFLFVRLAFLYTENIVSVSLLALVAFCNPASIGLSVFIRPYALQETAFIFFSYLFARYCSFLKSGASDFSLPLHAKSVLVLAFLLSTGYFGTFFAVFLGAGLLVFCAARRDWNNLLYFLSLFLGAIVVSKIAYLHYGVGFFEGRGTEAVSKLSDRLANLTVGTKTAVALISRNLFDFWKLLGAIAAGGALSALLCFRFGRGAKVSASHLALSLAAVLFSLVVLFFAPVKLLRYIAAAFPVLALAFAPVSRGRKATAVFIVLEAFVLFQNVRMTFPKKENGRFIEHLDDSDPKSAHPEYNRHPEIPVFIKSDFYAAFVVPYLNGGQTYILVDDVSQAEAYHFGEYYFIDYQFGKGFSETLIQNQVPGEKSK